MKQLMQHLKTGVTARMEAPLPSPSSNDLLLQTRKTLVSAGTERMLVSFGKANMLQKARQQPDKVKQVLSKMKSEGVATTLAKVKDKLETEMPLGYCHVGTVLEIGRNVQGFAVGDRVISNAPHADFALASPHLAARVPDNVSDEAASFTVLGAIALHGVRLIAPELGETTVVSGLGLVGLLAVQLLRANGCRVLAMDFDEARLEMAASFGAEAYNLKAGDPTERAMMFSRNQGVDAVLVCAATPSSEPMMQAAHMCRKRGRIVMTGVTGMQLERDAFFKKELSVQVSCSYGPGRYDEGYEKKLMDYPVAYVRWTEQRNFEAVLDLMADGRLDPMPLISHRYSFDAVEEAYQLLTSGKPSLGIVIDYPHISALPPKQVRYHAVATSPSHAAEGVAFLGAGAFATGTLIPAFRHAGGDVRVVISKSGTTAAMAARKFNIETASSDLDAVLADSSIGSLVIATPHSSHAGFTAKALLAGKHVYVEKPLAIDMEGLEQVAEAYHSTRNLPNAPQLMVGFNRRFAPQILAMKKVLALHRGLPKQMIYRVLAGKLEGHWLTDPTIGGGRIIGEGCHFVDLLCDFADSELTGYSASLKPGDEMNEGSISLAFADGSVGTVIYSSAGHHALPKEQLEVHLSGRSMILDNFRQLHCHGMAHVGCKKLARIDKGHRASVAAFLASTRTGLPAVPFEALYQSSKLVIEAVSFH